MGKLTFVVTKSKSEAFVFQAPCLANNHRICLENVNFSKTNLTLQNKNK